MRAKSCVLGVVAVAGLLSLLAPLPAMPPRADYGDARRGAEVLREKHCTRCHSIRGKGGTLAPDLSRRSGRRFTPATLAAMIWNHGPTMWRAMAAWKIEVPRISEMEMADLYTYFYSLRYFDPPGDAARGKAVFTNRRCSRCHALTPGHGGKGPPVTEWPDLANPVSWVQEMWNHAGRMAAEMERDGIAWPKFTVQEMVDLLVYLRHLPALPAQTPTLNFGDPATGERIFREHYCSRCHTVGEKTPGKINLLAVVQRQRTLTGLAVDMWNHRPRMVSRGKKEGVEIKPFKNHEMPQLLAYLLCKGYFQASGSARRGRKVFRAKGCESCHGQPGSKAPKLTAAEAGSSVRLASAVWRHGRHMQAEMQKRNFSWPALTERDVVDLIAFFGRE